MTLEYWKYDAGTDSIASLVIPAALGRKRTFDLDATLLVSVLAEAAERSHELTVEVDGKRLWTRRIPSHNPGESFEGAANTGAFGLGQKRCACDRGCAVGSALFNGTSP